MRETQTSDSDVLYRQEQQHLIVKEALEDKILLASVDKTANLVVLDVSTGNGSWLLDLSSDLPLETYLLGIDSTDTQFPSESSRPPNVSFSIGSILNLPDSLSHNHFDLIHQGFQANVLNMRAWPDVIEKMYDALRPGGWLQLEEDDHEYGHGPFARAQTLICEALSLLEGHDSKINRHLMQFLWGTPFDDREDRRIPVGAWAGEKGKRNARFYIGYFRSLKPRILELEKAGEMVVAQKIIGELTNQERVHEITDKYLENVVVGLEREWDATEGASVGLTVVYARKPLGA